MSRLSRQKIEAIQEANIKLLGEQDVNREEVTKIQKFLNAKKITDKGGNALKEDGLAGDSTKEAISKYQISLGVYPVSGNWSSDITKKMSPEDKKLLHSFGGWFDKLFN
jgi:hypothetical protein